jgi:hypothetical protein
MTRYQPELGQVVHGVPWGTYALNDAQEALFHGITDAIDDAYWNRYQTNHEWNDGDTLSIPGGIEIADYWWGDDEAPEASRPNFAFDGVEIRWYKHPYRGLSINKRMTMNQWVAWYDRCLAVIRAWDAESAQ